jgi:hypothetical protein
MKWLKKLFAVEETNSDWVTPSDLSKRVAEIQQRITTLKRSIDRTEKPYPSSPTQSKPLVDTTPQQSIDEARATKAEEMMAMKAKLLGKKS